jgi:uncharacterized protein (TIGR03083 family)
MEFSEYLGALRREGDLLAEAAAEAGLDAPVPTCPGWQVRELVQHIGVTHRWAAANVAEPEGRQVRLKDLLTEPVPDGEELVPWLRAGYAALHDTLAAAPPGRPCWAFVETADPLGFWARRQAHETAIHRADAVFALAGPVQPSHGTALAADGVAEVFDTMLPRRQARAEKAGTRLSDRERSVTVHVADTGDRWWARVTPDGVEVAHGADAARKAGCTVEGTAQELYLALWNRADLAELKVDGDAEVVQWWRERVRI